MPYHVVTLYADGRRVVVTQAKAPKLDQLQAAVGGYIETVPHFTRYNLGGLMLNRGVAYCNEIGMIAGLPFNEQAMPIRFSDVVFGVRLDDGTIVELASGKRG